jgi:catechol 2,3-dioxygenase-like lactoylglutathione lyase family enzyme
MNFTLTLAISDLERTTVFYGEILELAIERFVPVPGHPPVLLLGHGEATVLFRETAALEERHPALFQNLERHPRGVGVTLEFTVEALKPILKNIARRQLHTLYELEDDEFNRREVWLHDPDGYLVVLSEESCPPV